MIGKAVEDGSVGRAPDLIHRWFDLSGKVALVTGAGQGIGETIARVLASAGAAVAVNDFLAERAERVAAAIEADGGCAIATPFDVSDFDAARRAAETVATRLGPVEVLVNNAGNAGAAMTLGDWKPFWETGPSEWRNWLGVNLDGVMNCTHAVIDGMRRRNAGRIITITSDAGRVGDPRYAVYSAAKAGAAGFTRAISKALGRHGVTANCISLGGVATPAAETVLPNEEAVRKMLSYYVIRRQGTGEDGAALVLFLASDAASWITGQTYPVNGGFSFAV